MLNKLSARALAYAGAGFVLLSFCLAGVALVGFGLQAELAEQMSAGLAAILTGAAFLMLPAILFVVGSVRGRGRIAPKLEDVQTKLGLNDLPSKLGSSVGASVNAFARTALKSSNLPSMGPQAGSTLNATVNLLAKTAFLGLAARRPMATLGLAALAGAAISMSDTRKDSVA